MSNKLKELVIEMNAARARFRAEGEAAIKSAVKEFFEQNPEVTAIGWTQYAPYFNDGEPCEFGVGEMYATSMPLDHEDFEDRMFSWGDYPDEFNPDTKEVNEFLRDLSSVPEDIYESLFGTDSLIVITRDGNRVEDYSDHD